MKRKLLFILPAAMLLLLFGLTVTGALPYRDWWTGNEGVAMGDWDGSLLFDSLEGAAIARNVAHYEGSYSYRHYADCTVGECWAASWKTCSPAATQGRVDLQIKIPVGNLPEYPAAGTNNYGLIAIGDVTDSGEPPDMDLGLWLYYRPALDEVRVWCVNCNPGQGWSLGTIIEGAWHNFIIEWNMPAGASGTGELRIWQDGELYIDYDTLHTKPVATYTDFNDVAVGIVDWEFTEGADSVAYVDDVTVFGCSEAYPTPTPSPGTCNTYGNNAVLNIASDCSAVLRFEGIGVYVPVSATIRYLGLKVYGAAVDEPGQPVYITPLNAPWGELTADWCGRMMWTDWIEPGATNIPGDRDPVAVGSFETKLGWQQVELDRDALGVDWLINPTNPGLILHNENMVGKFSIPSNQWYDPVEDYSPQLVINWE